MYSYDKSLDIPLYRYCFPDLLRVEALLGTHRHLYCQYQFWEPIYAIAECPREHIHGNGISAHDYFPLKLWI